MDKPGHESKMMIKRFSELDGSWSIRPTEDGIVNGTQVDTQKANKIIDLLNGYGYDIEVIGSSEFLDKYSITFGNENNLIEYRAKIVEKESKESFEEDYRHQNDISSKMTDEQQDAMLEEYDRLEYSDMNGTCEYSFFVGKNIKKTILKQAAVYYGYLYTKMLNDIDADIVIKGDINDNLLDGNPDKFKVFLEANGIRITNKNVERISNVNYRIYKDSKFFEMAHSELRDYDEIIEAILKM